MQKKNQGFTLAEMLVCIGIVLALAAIALPQVFSSQRNLMLDEANAAAASVANAAQSQMTSLKNSGEWPNKIRDDEGNYLPTVVVAKDGSDANLRYVDANTARNLGIMLPGSVEGSIYNASYVIEFDTLTASVTRVFWTNGAGGILNGTSGKNDAVVAGYYADHSTEADDQEARRDVDGCAIGYYEGTPDGATNSIALVRPSVALDEYGKVILTNVNLADSARIKNITTSATFSYDLVAGDGTTTPCTFTVSGMTPDVSGYSVTVTNGENTYTFDDVSNALASGTYCYSIETSGKAYDLDLNNLVSAIETYPMDDPNTRGAYDTLCAIRDESVAKKDTGIEVVCTVTADDCKPVDGRAFIDWPKKVPTLKVLVTNPDPTAINTEQLHLDASKAKRSAYATGTFTDPDVKLIDKNGNPVQSSIINANPGLVSTNTIRESYTITNAWVYTAGGTPTHLPIQQSWFDNLERDNVQEGSQTYTGSTVKLELADSIEANVLVSVGSYTSDPSHPLKASQNLASYAWPTGKNMVDDFVPTGTKHDYQIFEVWLNDGESNRRVGYYKNDEWVWDDEILRNVVVPLDANGNPTSTITANTTQLVINTHELYGVPELSKYKEYSLYVRTSPRTSEVADWFGEYAPTFAVYTSASRTDTRGQNYARPIRRVFENEFGAASTVSAWTVSPDSTVASAAPAALTNMMRDRTGAFLPVVNTAFRVYYTAIPAIGWNTSENFDSRYLNLPNARIWYYMWDRSAAAVSDPLTMYAVELPGYAPFQAYATSSADIAMLPDTDFLFYHQLVFFDSDGKTRLDPKTFADQFKILPLSDTSSWDDYVWPAAPRKEGMSFVGWDLWTTDGRTMSVKPGTSVKDALANLGWGVVSCTAVYEGGVDKSVGFAYVSADGRATGFYADTIGAALEYDDAPLASVTNGSAQAGYYFIRHLGTGSAIAVDQNATRALAGGAYTVSTNPTFLANTASGARYAFYKVDFAQGQENNQFVELQCQMTGADFASRTFYANALFGGMVAGTEANAANFGTAAYPWRVYDAASFPAYVQTSHPALFANMADSTTNKNRDPRTNRAYTAGLFDDWYVQMRDIDFAAAGLGTPATWTKQFGGTYDGNGHFLTNAQVAMSSAGMRDENAVAATSAEAMFSAYGLFPSVIGYGTGTRAASINNLNIRIDDMVVGDSRQVGTIAGFGRYMTVDNVVVSCVDPNRRAQVTVTGWVPSTMSKGTNYNAVGGIVGRAIGSSVSNAFVANIDYLICKTQPGVMNAPEGHNAFGGIAAVGDLATGGINMSTWKNLTVASVSVTFDGSLTDSGSAQGIKCGLASGGIFGRAYFWSNASQFLPADQAWTVSDFSSTNVCGLPNSMVRVGAVSGSTGNFFPSANRGAIACSNVTYVSDTTYDLVANFQAKAPQTGDYARKDLMWFMLNEKTADNLKDSASLTSELGGGEGA